MDAYSMYLNTFRYVMNADPATKSTWCDIFKYLPTLRRMLSCAVCSNLLRNPHGAANGVCLHHVCYKCLGGKMILKPSCNWCKDHSCFKENKKLRALVLCFKSLCAYISHSRLGSIIEASSMNGHDKDVENTRNALKDAEQSDDEYHLTPPPAGPFRVMKRNLKEHKYSFSEYKPSTSGFVRNPKTSMSSENKVSPVQKQRKGKKRNVSNFALKSSPKSNASIHVKRLKRKALTTSRKRDAASKFKLKRKGEVCDKNISSLNSGALLVSQRPHRELSGKFSVGQLWRETFLEERSPEPDIYPDSGIEVGNSSDQDHGSQSPKSNHQGKEDKSSNSTSSSNKLPPYPLRETRLHPIPECHGIGNAMLSTAKDDRPMPPKLRLKIPKKRFQRISTPGRGAYFKKIEETVAVPSLTTKLSATKIKQIRYREVNTRAKNLLKQKKDVCRCSRFKRPNRLTCFGQKCLCYRDRKPCVDCLCNGCKNPRHHADSAPPLMHVSKGKDSQCLSPETDLTMPRLSPIPRM